MGKSWQFVSLSFQSLGFLLAEHSLLFNGQVFSPLSQFILAEFYPVLLFMHLRNSSWGDTFHDANGPHQVPSDCLRDLSVPSVQVTLGWPSSLLHSDISFLMTKDNHCYQYSSLLTNGTTSFSQFSGRLWASNFSFWTFSLHFQLKRPLTIVATKLARHWLVHQVLLFC